MTLEESIRARIADAAAELDARRLHVLAEVSTSLARSRAIAVDGVFVHIVGQLADEVRAIANPGEPLDEALLRLVREANTHGSPAFLAERLRTTADRGNTALREAGAMREEIARLRRQIHQLDADLEDARVQNRELREQRFDPKTSPVAAARKALKRANEALISGGDLEKNFIRPDGSIDHEKLQAQIRADQIERGKKTLELLKEARRLIDALPDSRAKSRPSLDALYRDLESTAKAFVSQKFDDWRRAAGAREAPRAHAVRSVSFDPAVFGALFEFGSPSTLEAARRRYRELAKSAHPDRGGSHERMVALNKAFEVLERHFGGTSV